MINFDSAFYAKKFGIVIPGNVKLLEDSDKERLAMDAQSPLITTANAGIPAFLTNYLDPEVIKVLVTPMKAVTIFGEAKKGDWTTQTAMFPIEENTGEVSSYGDYNNNGSANANYNWVSRQSYLFQTITQWGELELDRAGAGKVNYAAGINTSSALALAKFSNASYFYGVAGLLNYGLLNDPALSAAIAPTTKAAGGTTWAVATADEIYDDIVKLYNQAQTQLKGLVDQEDEMVLALDPTTATNLSKTNQFGLNVYDKIKKNFPKARIETAVQYATGSGNEIQMIFPTVQGQDTGYCAFNEKMRAHPIKVELSSYQQKKTSGTWGAVIKMPIAIASMIGI